MVECLCQVLMHSSLS